MHESLKVPLHYTASNINTPSNSYCYSKNNNNFQSNTYSNYFNSESNLDSPKNAICQYVKNAGGNLANNLKPTSFSQFSGMVSPNFANSKHIVNNNFDRPKKSRAINRDPSKKHHKNKVVANLCEDKIFSNSKEGVISNETEEKKEYIGTKKVTFKKLPIKIEYTGTLYKKPKIDIIRNSLQDFDNMGNYNQSNRLNSKSNTEEFENKRDTSYRKYDTSLSKSPKPQNPEFNNFMNENKVKSKNSTNKLRTKYQAAKDVALNKLESFDYTGQIGNQKVIIFKKKKINKEKLKI